VTTKPVLCYSCNGGHKKTKNLNYQPENLLFRPNRALTSLELKTENLTVAISSPNPTHPVLKSEGNPSNLIQHGEVQYSLPRGGLIRTYCTYRIKTPREPFHLNKGRSSTVQCFFPNGVR
jgi:hypothetical protein